MGVDAWMGRREGVKGDASGRHLACYFHAGRDVL